MFFLEAKTDTWENSWTTKGLERVRCDTRMALFSKDSGRTICQANQRNAKKRTQMVASMLDDTCMAFSMLKAIINSKMEHKYQSEAVIKSK